MSTVKIKVKKTTTTSFERTFSRAEICKAFGVPIDADIRTTHGSWCGEPVDLDELVVTWAVTEEEEGVVE